MNPTAAPLPSPRATRHLLRRSHLELEGSRRCLASSCSRLTSPSSTLPASINRPAHLQAAAPPPGQSSLPSEPEDHRTASLAVQQRLAVLSTAPPPSLFFRCVRCPILHSVFPYYVHLSSILTDCCCYVQIILADCCCSMLVECKTYK